MNDLSPPAQPPAPDAFSLDDMRQAWGALNFAERAEGFRLLPREDSEEFFGELDTYHQARLILSLPAGEQKSWVRLLPPDDAADLVQEAPTNEQSRLLELLDAPTRKEVAALLAYAEDDAGGLMNPRYARVRPTMSADEAISYLRKQTRDKIEMLSYVYVLNADQKLLGVVSFRDLFMALPERRVEEIMKENLVSAHEELDQEALSRLFYQHSLMAIPVVDDAGRMKGIVTVDDIVDVVHEEATEDIQKYGGMEALDQPYLQVSLFRMIQKRGGWLSALFLGEMLTATAMSFFEGAIAKAVVLALFVPLIISSGGNSGSQASTLVIRAMALGEVRMMDWWRVVRREILTGLALGVILGGIGFLRISIWGRFFGTYGDKTLPIAVTVAMSLLGVVTFGTLAGSTLPFVLRRLNFDPASASGPFVATLVDVTGLIIYFSVASFVLSGGLF